MKALLQSVIDWVARLFRSDTLIIEDDILLPPPKRSTDDKPAAVSWEKLFTILDEIIDVEKIVRQSEAGVSNASHRTFRRRFGTYIYFGDVTDFAPTVQHVDALDLPAMFSVANGHTVQSLIDQGHDRCLRMLKVTAFKIERKHIPVERHDGALYEASFLFASRARKKRWGKTQARRAMSAGVFFSVGKDGVVRALKYQGKHSSVLTELSLMHKTPLDTLVVDAEADFAQYINAFRQRDSNWLVKVEDTRKGLVRATFGIQPLDAPRVFNARVKIRTASGKTKPIFHPVRAHERERADGATSIVKLHHRGLTKFQWRGYDCEIAIPSWRAKRVKGAATPIMNDWIMPAMTFDKSIPMPAGMATPTQVAEKIAWEGSRHNQARETKR